MTTADGLLQDQLLRLLEGAPRGMTVERLRALLVAAGSKAGKEEIVLSLRALSDRGLTQIGAARKWHLRRLKEIEPRQLINAVGRAADDVIGSVPCSAFIGANAIAEEPIPDGRLIPDLPLLKRLMPYYEEALRAGDGGAPIETLSQANDRFVFLQPDAPWWPLARQGRTIRVPLGRLPSGFKTLLAKNAGNKLLVGYPINVFSSRDAEGTVFFQPVSIYRCRFMVTDSHAEIYIPAMPPSLVEAWIKGKRSYGGWDARKLRNWLLLEDQESNVDEEDEISSPDFVEIPPFAARLATAVGREVRQPLDPSAIASSVPTLAPNGYYNALALMPDAGSKYTRTAIGDYEALLQKSVDDLNQSALSSLFGGETDTAEPPATVHPFPLAESQLLATRAALSGPLTVITGPPGTGKSQVIAAIMLSAAAAGKTVLFAARQHRALDAVQERLHDFTSERVLLVRANEAEGYGGFTFMQALQGMQTRADPAGNPKAFDQLMARVQGLDSNRWSLLEQWRDLREVTENSALIATRIDDVKRELSETLANNEAVEEISAKPGFWRRLLAALRLYLGNRLAPKLVGKSWARSRLEKRLERLEKELAVEEAEIRRLRATLGASNDDPVTLSDTIVDTSKTLVLRLLDRLDTISSADRKLLAEISGDAALKGAKSLGSATHRLILKHFPLWAVTTLSAGSRIPLEAGLFDYVIFDEAAQIDIASSIPLLYRAKKAVIVGDPLQLTMISNLEPREERDLLHRHGLMRAGIGLFAQGRTSLFDLAASSSSTSRFILTDHYRCHPQIAGYINQAFYGRRLNALTDVARLRVPNGFRAGLHWTDVTGPVVARTGNALSGSALSNAEATAIVTHLQLLIDQGFEGTIGVVTFFDYQARTISELATAKIGAAKLDKCAVKVFTANKFQGDERDVMLLSLCLGPSMPLGAKNFIQRERRLLNVAVSRARAVCHIFGNLDYASACGIPHIESLVAKVRQAQEPTGRRGEDRFESPWERRLFNELVAHGFSPQCQLPVGGRFLDLALVDEGRNPPKHIDIEVDGVAFHTDQDGNRLPTDLWRDHQLRALGWTVLRFWVYELRDNMETCIERIKASYNS